MGLVIVGTALIILGAILGLVGAFNVDGERTASGRAASSGPIDLASLFATDFNFLSIDRTASVRVQIPENGLDEAVQIKVRTFRDFAGNAEFMAVYVPFFSDARLSAATLPFLENLKNDIKQARDEAKLIGVISKIGRPKVLGSRFYLHS
jgi:hypothetical protein